MGEKIFDELERGWDAFTSHVVHRHYHDPSAPAIPPAEAFMSLLTTIEADAEQALTEVQSFVREKLPAAVADAKKVEGWLQLPGAQAVLDALTGNSHLPEVALQGLASMIGTVGNLYARPEAPADPAADPQPEPAQAA